MATDRELQFFLTRIAGQAERYPYVLTVMDDIIAGSAAPSADERII
jgi:hypothetical protein